MSKPLIFSISNDLEFLLPNSHVGNYDTMKAEVETQNRINPPKKSKWSVGGVDNKTINMMVELWFLKVLPPDFFDLPLANGGSFWLWNNGYKTKEILGVTSVRDVYAWRLDFSSMSRWDMNPEQMKKELIMGFKPIFPGENQSFFLSNKFQ